MAEFSRNFFKPRWLQENFIDPKYLSIKVANFVALSGIFFFSVISIIVYILIYNNFSNIENLENLENIRRAKSEVQSLESFIEKNNVGWAIWTNAFDYINDGNEKFLESNVNTTQAKGMGVQGFAFFRFDRQPRAIFYFNKENGQLNHEMVHYLDMIGQSKAIFDSAKSKSTKTFFAVVKNRILAISSAPVTRSDGSGTSSGYIVMANEVSSSDFSDSLQVRAKIDTNNKNSLGVSRDSYNKLLFRVALPGIDGSPVAVVSYKKDRLIMGAGRNLQFTIIAGVFLLFAFLIGNLVYIINRLLVAPLRNLKKLVDEISRTGELIEINHDGRRDEIGSLVVGFNRMIGQLRDLRVRMDAQSFQIGKSQNAIGSLHNVSNGLSPVKTLLSLLPQDLAFPSKKSVMRALDELRTEDVNPTRRDQLVTFIHTAVESNVEKLNAAQFKLSEAHRAIDNVVDTISSQQASNRSGDAAAMCDLTSVVSSSLAIAIYNANGLKIAVDFTDKERRIVLGDRVLIAQVIGNVLTNAVEAITASGRSEGKIWITGSTVTLNERLMECITISDNGDGFEPAKAAVLFQHGFSTRRNKHGGLGLHWCANTINALSGSLTIESAGPGLGATTTVMLPSAAEEQSSVSFKRASDVMISVES